MSEIAIFLQGLFPIIVILFSIILHEVAHGYAAYIQGDETAYRAGRLTLNPIPHIDVMGSVIVPFFAFFVAGTFFGWAKPVPYNPHNIQSKIGQAFVAAAGVLTNLFIALATLVIFKILVTQGVMNIAISQACIMIITVNISLAFFNLIPIPPFDGMSIIQSLFPRLHINNSLVYNPIYLIGAIIVASVLYRAFMPYVFTGLQAVLT